MEQAGRRQTLDVFGVQVELVLTSEQTGGSHAVYEVTAVPQAGPPPHVHGNDDETFYVLEGELEVLRGAERIVAGPGSCVFLPRQVPHSFCNRTEQPVRFLGVATPGGHERFFVEADRLMREGLFTPESGAELCARYGMQILLPPAA